MSASISDTPGNGDQADQAPAIVWFRDCLRVADNPALVEAARSRKPLLCVYVLDQESVGYRNPGAAQDWFLHHCLKALDRELGQRGARLDILRGQEAGVIRQLAENTRASAIYWNRRRGQAELETDRLLKAGLRKSGMTAESFQANLLHEPALLKTTGGGPFRVYSPFWRALESGGEPRAPLPAPGKLTPAGRPDGAVELDSLGLLPIKPNWATGWEQLWPPGEKGAADLFAAFLGQGINGYASGRDLPAESHVSRLSPYLRFGAVSPFQLWHGVRQAELAGKANARDALKFLKELAWREFSHHLLFHYPDLAWKNYQDRFDDFPWREDGGNDLAAWQQGRTGYPFIDAGMRELWQTGYMHNRVRMAVASFLVKHLLIHWRRGEEWFWDTLVDGDPANNAASWQWVAGCGADAAPYFRVFNPILQGRKFDADGNYVRKWVPELAKLSNKYLHAPWEAPESELSRAGVKLGETYPRPVIEHSFARNRALEAFGKIKKDEG